MKQKKIIAQLDKRIASAQESNKYWQTLGADITDLVVKAQDQRDAEAQKIGKKVAPRK